MRQYDPLKVVGSFAWAGGSVDILDGTVNEGDFATVEDDNPRWSRETGVDAGHFVNYVVPDVYLAQYIEGVVFNISVEQ